MNTLNMLPLCSFYLCISVQSINLTDFVDVEMVNTEDKRHLSVLVWVQVEWFPDLEVIFMYNILHLQYFCFQKDCKLLSIPET